MGDIVESVELKDYLNDVINDVAISEKFKTYDIKSTLATGKGENYSGVLYRVTIKGEKYDRKEATLGLIVKVPLDSEVMREKFPLGEIYIREMYVYNVILPKLCTLQDKYNVPENERFQFIRCLKTSPEDRKEYLVLEDISLQGFGMFDRKSPIGYKQLKLILKKLASYHALSFVLKLEDNESYVEMSKHVGNSDDYNDEFMKLVEASKERAIAVMDEQELVDKLREFGVDLQEKLKYYVDANSVDNFSVLCHGDCWSNNILYKFQENEAVDLRFLDWQVVKNASPVIDIAYLLFMSTDLELRRAHFDELMDHYHDCLATSLNYLGQNIESCYSKALFENHLKKILPYGLILAFTCLPIILAEAEDAVSIENLIDNAEANPDQEIKNKTTQDKFGRRIRGVVRSMIDMHLI